MALKEINIKERKASNNNGKSTMEIINEIVRVQTTYCTMMRCTAVRRKGWSGVWRKGNQLIFGAK